MITNLSRSKPALPNSYFWTWDHRANWAWDDPGGLNYGCDNRYLKRPETFIEDYRRLTDWAANLGVKGIVIWGFLRDSHGGVKAARRVAEYARSRGVAILPGVGAGFYGGFYYEGKHPYNLETFLDRNPKARMVCRKGDVSNRAACPSNGKYLEWLQKGIEWLFDEFPIGGVNIENGDWAVCYCPACQARRAKWPDDPNFFCNQAMHYQPVLEALRGRLKSQMIMWTTYTGFIPGRTKRGFSKYAFMHCRRPTIITDLPPEALCQWTLTGMVLKKPLPLTAYLDQGVPRAVMSNPVWPPSLCPPTRRSVGYLHHNNFDKRYCQVISSIKEACVRAYRAGLEGVAIYGEVSARHIPAALNYLAFSHFIHWPEDTLRQFGRKTLGQVLGQVTEGEAFVEMLAHWDAGAVTKTHKQDAAKREQALRKNVAQGRDLKRWQYWRWLAALVAGHGDPQTASEF